MLVSNTEEITFKNEIYQKTFFFFGLIVLSFYAISVPTTTQSNNLFLDSYCFNQKYSISRPYCGHLKGDQDSRIRHINTIEF